MTSHILRAYILKTVDVNIVSDIRHKLILLCISNILCKIRSVLDDAIQSCSIVNGNGTACTCQWIIMNTFVLDIRDHILCMKLIENYLPLGRTLHGTCASKYRIRYQSHQMSITFFTHQRNITLVEIKNRW